MPGFIEDKQIMLIGIHNCICSLFRCVELLYLHINQLFNPISTIKLCWEMIMMNDYSFKGI